MTPRLLVIIMHGAGRYYVEPLLAAGRLPNLARLIGEGHHRYFRSELPLAAGAWVTLMTGESVGVHGVIDYIDLDARRYDGLAGRYSSSASYAARSVQTLLSEAGRRVASIYLPMTSPPWPINGVMISGFPLLDERRPATFPPEIGRTLPMFAPHRLLTLRYDDRSGLEDYLRVNLDRIEAVTAAACGEDYDVILSCLPTPDLAHHYFWRPDDPEALERIHVQYERVDSAIGRLAEKIPDDGTVVVLSDHGGRAAPSRLFGVNRWLADAGYLFPRRSLTARPAAIRAANHAVNWAKRMRLNHLFANRIRGTMRRRVSAVTHNTAFVDWSRTTAYGVDFVYPLVGISLNLEGRQDRGLVAPAAYGPLREDLIRRLRDVIDTDSGQRVFAAVDGREAFFHGPHLERFPDVIGMLSDDYDAKGHLDLPVVGPNAAQWDYPFMGYHAIDALFVARGPNVRPGTSLDDSPMVDVAPTLLALAGVKIPATMEGRPFAF